MASDKRKNTSEQLEMMYNKRIKRHLTCISPVWSWPEGVWWAYEAVAQWSPAVYQQAHSSFIADSVPQLYWLHNSSSASPSRVCVSPFVALLAALVILSMQQFGQEKNKTS